MAKNRTSEQQEPRPFLVPTRLAVRMLDLDEDRVRQLAREGELVAVRISSAPGVEARKLRILVSSIEAYVERLVEEQHGQNGNVSP